MNHICAQEKNILQIFRVIQVNQEIIDDFGAFSFNMNIRLYSNFMQS